MKLWGLIQKLIVKEYDVSIRSYHDSRYAVVRLSHYPSSDLNSSLHAEERIPLIGYDFEAVSMDALEKLEKKLDASRK